MKPIVFSRHARRDTRYWGICHEEVLATLATPDRLLPTVKGRLNAIKEVEDGFLRVTYMEYEDHILIVTITPRKRPW